MIRFLIGLLVLLGLAGAVVGYLWYVADSLEPTPRTMEKVIPYDQIRR